MSRTVARLSAESANIVRLPSQRSRRALAHFASPMNGRQKVGLGWFADGGRSTKFGLAQYGHVAVRTPSKARLAPHWLHENVVLAAVGATSNMRVAS